MTLEPLSPLSSYFDILQIPVGVSDDVLTRRFRELARAYHPDRFANADIETQTHAQDSSALLNEAYRVLRDPFGRAEYLLRRERGTTVDDLKTAASPPKELLAVVLELQENLMEFREARDDGDNASAELLRPALLSAKQAFETAYAQMSDVLYTLFTRYDTGDATERAQVLTEIAAILGRRGYLRRVLANLQTVLN